MWPFRTGNFLKKFTNQFQKGDKVAIKLFNNYQLSLKIE